MDFWYTCRAGGNQNIWSVKDVFWSNEDEMVAFKKSERKNLIFFSSIIFYQMNILLLWNKHVVDLVLKFFFGFY